MLRFLDMIIFCTRHLPNFPNLSISVNLHKVKLLHSSSYWTITFHFDQTIPIWSCKLTPEVHFVWFYIPCVLVIKLHLDFALFPSILNGCIGCWQNPKVIYLLRSIHYIHCLQLSPDMKDWTQNPNTFEVIIKYHLLVKDVFAD